MNNYKDLDPRGRDYRAFRTGEKGQLRRKGEKGDQTRSVRENKLPKKALFQDSLPGQGVKYLPASQPSYVRDSILFWIN